MDGDLRVNTANGENYENWTTVSPSDGLRIKFYPHAGLEDRFFEDIQIISNSRSRLYSFRFFDRSFS